MSKQSSNKTIKYKIQSKTIPENIITLLYLFGAITLKSVTNLSQARESASREKTLLKKQGYIKERKRYKKPNAYYKTTMIVPTKKLVDELRDNKLIKNIENNFPKSSVKTIGKKIIGAEITSLFMRMKSDIYLGEANTPNLTNDFYVPYTMLNEFLKGESKHDNDSKIRLINGLYVNNNMLYPIYFIPEDDTNFYYIRKKSGVFFQSHIRKLPSDSTNIIFLTGKKNQSDILKRFILNEEKRNSGYDKFYNFFAQKYDTYLIPSKEDCTYEITRLATNPDLNNNLKNEMSNRLEKILNRRFYEFNYFKKDNIWYFYTPIIKVKEMKDFVSEVLENNKDREVNIGIITFKENLNLIIDYLQEVLVNKNNKKVKLQIMNDLSEIRSRKSPLEKNIYILEK